MLPVWLWGVVLRRNVHVSTVAHADNPVPLPRVPHKAREDEQNSPHHCRGHWQDQADCVLQVGESSSCVVRCGRCLTLGPSKQDYVSLLGPSFERLTGFSPKHEFQVLLNKYRNSAEGWRDMTCTHRCARRTRTRHGPRRDVHRYHAPSGRFPSRPQCLLSTVVHPQVGSFKHQECVSRQGYLRGQAPEHCILSFCRLSYIAALPLRFLYCVPLYKKCNWYSYRDQVKPVRQV